MCRKGRYRPYRFIINTPARGLVLVLELMVTNKMRDRVLGASFCAIACGAAYWAFSNVDATTGVQMYP